MPPDASSLPTARGFDTLWYATPTELQHWILDGILDPSTTVFSEGHAGIVRPWHRKWDGCSALCPPPKASFCTCCVDFASSDGFRTFLGAGNPDAVWYDAFTIPPQPLSLMPYLSSEYVARLGKRLVNRPFTLRHSVRAELITGLWPDSSWTYPRTSDSDVLCTPFMWRSPATWDPRAIETWFGVVLSLVVAADHAAIHKPFPTSPLGFSIDEATEAMDGLEFWLRNNQVRFPRGLNWRGEAKTMQNRAEARNFFRHATARLQLDRRINIELRLPPLSILRIELAVAITRDIRTVAEGADLPITVWAIVPWAGSRSWINWFAAAGSNVVRWVVVPSRVMAVGLDCDWGLDVCGTMWFSGNSYEDRHNARVRHAEVLEEDRQQRHSRILQRQALAAQGVDLLSFDTDSDGYETEIDYESDIEPDSFCLDKIDWDSTGVAGALV